MEAEYCPGREYPIALRVRYGRTWRLEVVRPKLRVVGCCGCETWYYPDDVEALLYLEFLPNVGRLVTMPACFLQIGWYCGKIKELAKKMWEVEGKSESEIEAVLGSLAIY
jgi:hypothetical protein